MNIWKKNILEDLEEEELEYKSMRKFLATIKKKFGGGEECCYLFVLHISCFVLSFYLTSYSFLPNLFPYIRLDCIFLCIT